MGRPTRETLAYDVQKFMRTGSEQVEPDESVYKCNLCRDMGMLVVRQPNGSHLAETCSCRKEKRTAQLLERCRIPERYLECTLENFETRHQGLDQSLFKALNTANVFVRDYPHRAKGIGMLFTGSVGTGKTHLAVGILRGLVQRRGVRALFCDHRELLKSVNNSYNPKVSTTELEVLKPVFDAEVLVIDELGSAKKTEWVSDIVEHILNTRYNDHRTTIITTNYPNLAAGKASVEPEPEMREEPYGATSNHADLGSGNARMTYDDILDRRDVLEGRKAVSAATESPGNTRLSPARTFATQKSAASSKANLDQAGKDQARKPSRVRTEETLGDRIGERMRSRLAEMCVTVEMTGKDYRQGAKRATFH